MTFRRLVATCVGSVCLIAGLRVSDAAGAEQSAKDKDAAQLRVGTFDSRALAVAYARSRLFANRLKSLRADYDKAKKAGDAERVKTLEAQGQAQQELFHKQGFSTWPVDDILEQIKSDIPKIAEQAGVDLIVSKWHIAFQRPGVECVDVTDLLVKPFQPDADTLKVIQELRKRHPVSLEELKKNEH